MPNADANLAGMMVIDSAVHALWVPRGLAIKYSDAVGGYAPELIAALGSYWELAYDLAAVPAYFGAILLAMLVVLGKSLYPRWTVLANFGVLSLLAPLAERTSAPFGAIFGRRFYESFYRNLFPGVGRFHVESAGDLTMRLS